MRVVQGSSPKAQIPGWVRRRVVKRVFVVLILPLLAQSVSSAHPPRSTGAPQEPNSTVLEGVFTTAQARRGQQVYDQDCALCHGPELQGGEAPGGVPAPSLAGSEFIVFWTELSVGSLFDRIKASMPQDAPGRLADEEHADVVAYMLEANSYPAGDVNLPADKPSLDTIMLVTPE